MQGDQDESQDIDFNLNLEINFSDVPWILMLQTLRCLRYGINLILNSIIDISNNATTHIPIELLSMFVLCY